MLTTAIVTLALWATPVTFESRPNRLETTLIQLSQTAGIKLSCTTELKDDAVVIRVHDVSLDDLLERIARIEDSEWRAQSDGGRILRRSDAKVRARVKQELQSHVDSLKAQFARIGDLAKKNAMSESELTDSIRKMTESAKSHVGDLEPPSGVPNMTKVWAALPAVQALDEIVSQGAAEEWAALRPNRAIVYSSSPNALQKPFKKAWSLVVKHAIERQAAISKAVGPGALVTDLGAFRSIEPGAKAVLEVNCDQSRTLHIGLRIRDLAGGASPSYYQYLYPGLAGTASQLSVPDDIGAKTLPIAPETREFIEWVTSPRREMGGNCRKRSSSATFLPSSRIR